LSLPQPNKKDGFEITDRDRETICCVYLYNSYQLEFVITVIVISLTVFYGQCSLKQKVDKDSAKLELHVDNIAIELSVYSQTRLKRTPAYNGQNNLNSWFKFFFMMNFPGYNEQFL